MVFVSRAGLGLVGFAVRKRFSFAGSSAQGEGGASDLCVVLRGQRLLGMNPPSLASGADFAIFFSFYGPRLPFLFLRRGADSGWHLACGVYVCILLVAAGERGRGRVVVVFPGLADKKGMG